MKEDQLEGKLEEKLLLKDEMKMWLRVGFYISTEPHDVFIGPRSQSPVTSCLDLIDRMGNVWSVPKIIGANLRSSVLEWWEVERITPRAQELDPTGLNELESRRG